MLSIWVHRSQVPLLSPLLKSGRSAHRFCSVAVVMSWMMSPFTLVVTLQIGADQTIAPVNDEPFTFRMARSTGYVYPCQLTTPFQFWPSGNYNGGWLSGWWNSCCCWRLSCGGGRVAAGCCACTVCATYVAISICPCAAVAAELGAEVGGLNSVVLRRAHRMPR